MIPDYDRLVKYMKFLVRYKEDVISRMSDATGVKPLRFPIGQTGSKSKILEWLDEEFVKSKSENELKQYLMDKWVMQVSATKIPNELVIELDIEDEAKAKINYLVLERALRDLNLKYIAVYTGGKSIHYHIYIKPDMKSYTELKKAKAKIVEFIKDFVEGLDLQVTHDTTPARIPYTVHPETLNKVSFVNHQVLNNIPLEWWDEKALEFYKKLEVNVEYKENHKPRLLVDKFNIYKLSKAYQRRGKGSRLSELYYRVLNEQWEDGKDRLLMILFSLAKKLNLNVEQFEQDVKDWLQKQPWDSERQRKKREATFDWLLRVYDKKEYSYKWAVKQFLEAEDIEDKAKEKFMKILEDLKIKEWFIK